VKQLIALVLCASALAACGSAGRKHRKKVDEAPPVDPAAWNGVATVAVMPPDCWTIDIDLEFVVWYRGVINEILRQRGWGVVPCVQVNRTLNELRFGMAGELSQLSPEETATKFGCNAMLYWAILQSDSTIEIAFELIKADGTKLWSSGSYKFKTPFLAHPEGAADSKSQSMAMALGEALKKFPVRP